MKLSCDCESIDIELRETESRFSNNKFEIISNSGLAFDHPVIIENALSVLKKEVEDFDVTFDFLPEKFTLASLQKVPMFLVNHPYFFPHQPC